MKRRIGATLGAILLLAAQACETHQREVASAARTDATTVVVPPTVPRKSKDTARQASLAPPEPTLSAADRNPQRLLRMNPRSLATLLGKPQFVRREADARVWQYRSESCVLDVFLYHVAATHEVTHFEFRPATTLSGPTPGCFEALLTRAGAIASS